MKRTRVRRGREWCACTWGVRGEGPPPPPDPPGGLWWIFFLIRKIIILIGQILIKGSQFSATFLNCWFIYERYFRVQIRLNFLVILLKFFKHQLRCLAKLYGSMTSDISTESINSLIQNAKNLSQVVLEVIRNSHACSIRSDSCPVEWNITKKKLSRKEN